MDDEEPIPPDVELKKRLFNSPDKNSERAGREDGERSNERPHRKGSRAKSRNPRAGFRLSVLGVLLFLLLCALALAITLHFNEQWKQITWEEAKEGAAHFFSDKPLKGNQRVYALFGLLGALPLAAAIGACTGAFTCLFMYYDSDVPGDFPPTPVSPRRGADSPSPSESRWHLGYIFVPVNTLVAFSLALFYLRLQIGFPIV